MKLFKPKFTITNKIANALTSIERARGFLEAAKLSDAWLARMSSQALLLEAHHTTHIEGTQLSLEQAEQIWNGKDVLSANPDDKRELLNYRDAFEFVSQYLSKDSAVSEALICEIHRKLVDGVRGEQGQPGQYRSGQNYVVNGKTGEIIYTPPLAPEVPALMARLCEYLNTESDVHPVLIAGIAQFQLVHIHPFVDGNGRSSRLLSTLCLYRSGYDFKRLFSISEYYDRNRPEFYWAIQSVREQNMDFSSWLEYFTNGLAVQLEETKQRGQHVIKADLFAREYKLNQRQENILQYLLENVKIDIQSMEVLCPEANRRTLQRDIKALIEKGIISVTGATNNLIYHIKEEI